MPKKMERLYPRKIRDKAFLSRLLGLYIQTLEQSPFELTMRNLAWDTQIPESIWHRLMRYHQTPSDEHLITVEDFHIAFSNIMIHYPTVAIWRDIDGGIYISV